MICTSDHKLAAMNDSPSDSEPESQIPELVDEQLMERLHGGDHAAATAIYVRYADKLLGVARRNTPADLRTRFDPEDIVQSVFRTFFRRAAKGAYAVPAGDDLWKLFLVISLNKIRRLGEFHRSGKRNVSRTSALTDPASQASGPAVDDSMRILEMTIDEILADSPAHVRQMVKLRIEGNEVAEIATKTGRSKRSVERVLQNFRKSLAEQLGQSGVE
jgi:RNA polymerase sigma-70 factor (ECF subfamily)